LHNSNTKTACVTPHPVAQFLELHSRGAISPFARWCVVAVVIDFKNDGKKETPMQQNRLFEELSGKISALLAQSPAKDAEKNLRALLASFFARLDLVTREEFDVQARLLARSREQIDTLEARVAELEARVSKPNA
jgi:ubiquinone biosynthesis accessory factor UbiK